MFLFADTAVRDEGTFKLAVVEGSALGEILIPRLGLKAPDRFVVRARENAAPR